MSVVQIIIYVIRVVHVSLFKLEDASPLVYGRTGQIEVLTDRTGPAISYEADSPHCSYLIYSPFRRAEIWRLFSYMFVHVSIQHLLTNVFLQILVCVIVKDIVLYCEHLARPCEKAGFKIQ